MALEPWITTAAGVKMPRIIYGTAWKKERTADLVEKAFTLGFRGVDTACQPKHYHEAGVGTALRRLFASGITRDEVFIQTKFTSFSGQDPAACPYDPKSDLATQVATSFKVSQNQLGVESVDSLVLHGPLPHFADTLTVWKAMEDLHDAGLAKQLGMSNFYSTADFKRFYEKVRVKPAVLQNRWVGETRHDRALRAFCREKSIVYQSFWTLTGNPRLLESGVVRNIARSFSKTPEQILFRFLIQRGSAPLTGTCSDEHMAQDLDAWQGGWELSKEDVVKIGGLVDEDFGDEE